MFSIKDIIEKEFCILKNQENYKENPSEYLTEYFDSIPDKSGLYVLNLPTGSGKTHNIFRFINGKGRKHYPFCIYVVPQRKQRENAYDEYQSAIKKYGIDKDECLILYGAVEQAEMSYTQKVHEEIREQLVVLDCRTDDVEINAYIKEAIKVMEELMIALQYRIDFPMLKKIENGIAGDKAVGRLDTMLRIELRKILVGVLGKKRHEEPESRKEMNENVEMCKTVLPSIVKLYPWLGLYKCKTVLCTASKFLYSLPMLINPDIMLFNSELTEKSLVVLDESDGVYQDWRNQLLTNPSARTVYGLYNTFNKVCNSLLAAKGKIPFNHVCVNEIERLITETGQKRDSLLEAVGMYPGLDIYTAIQPEKQRFCVFHADENRHLLTTRGKEMVDTDLGHNEENVKLDSVYSVAREMVSILQYVASNLSNIVNVYMERQKKQEYEDSQNAGKKVEEKKVNVVMFDKAVSNILHKVNLDKLDGEIIEAIKRMGNLYSYNNRMDLFADDYSHYDKGWMMVFLRFDKQDKIKNNCRTEINYLAHNVSSEKIIRYMIQNRNMTVALMSATASSTSLSTNFNLEYLKTVLDKDMMHIPTQVLKDWEKSMEQYIPDLEQRPVVCMQLPEGEFEQGKLDGTNYIPKGAENLFPEGMRNVGMLFLRELGRMLDNSVVGSENKTVEYYMAQYYKFFTAYKNFHEDTKLHSALCLSERLPKDSRLDGGMRWNKTVLSQGAALIDGRISSAADYSFMRLPVQFEDSLVYISSAEYDKEVEELLKDWEAGKKRMAVSSYKTVGAGMNLAYRIPEGIRTTGRKLPYMNDIPDRNIKKDIDCIVLMDITGHRNFNRYSAKTGDDVELQIYQYITFLLALQFNGKISYGKVRSEISQVIAFGQSILNDKMLGLVEDLKQYQLYKIVQSMGRISRSTIKGMKTTVMYDGKLLNGIADAPDNLAYTFEMRCLQQHARKLVMADGGAKQQKQKEKLQDYLILNRCESSRSKIKSRIAGALAFYKKQGGEVPEYTKRLQEHVEKIKTFICQYPTLEEKDMNGLASCLLWNYIGQGQNGAEYSVMFEEGKDLVVKNFSAIRANGYTDVNEQATYLPLLVQNKDVREWFMQEKIALSWNKGQYILAPYQALSTYKGCIGEQAFASVMHGFFKVKLEKLMGGLYEVGDWVDLSRGLLFDVKNYAPVRPTFLCEKDLLPNYRHKLEKSGMKLVVVNVLCNHDNPVIDDSLLDGKVVFINGIINSTTGQLISKSVEYMVQLLNSNI